LLDEMEFWWTPSKRRLSGGMVLRRLRRLPVPATPAADN
jgi:hypothetical protein